MRFLRTGLALCCGALCLWACDTDPSHGLPGTEDCLNGLDDDGDELIDCDDPDCALHEACVEPWTEVLCRNGVDDDGDGQIDCDDPDCQSRQECQSGREVACADQQDNDGDGLADCRDPDCVTNPACQESCTDGVDNDLDGLTDCLDDDCAQHPDCAGPAEDCTNGVDDDGDQKIDCDDPECKQKPECPGPGLEICDNEFDDDGDGLVDCLDDDCVDFPRCGGEIQCADGLDDDGDGLVDCDDPDCVSRPTCFANEQCLWSESISCGIPDDVLESSTVGRVSNFEEYGLCDPLDATYPAGERIYRFLASGNNPQFLVVTLTSYASPNHRLFVVVSREYGQGCTISADHGCYAGETQDPGTEAVNVLLDPGTTAYIIVDGAVAGDFDLGVDCDTCYGLNCDGVCVTDSTTNPNHCGNCDTVCAVGIPCVEGVCGGSMSVACNGTYCEVPNICCHTTTEEYCTDLNTCGGYVAQSCDGPEDCESGQRCCASGMADGGTFCSPSGCPYAIVCTTDAYCVAQGGAAKNCCPAPDGSFNVCVNNPGCQ